MVCGTACLKEVIKEIKVDEKRSLIPIIAKEVFNKIDPNEIHEESLRLLHNCGFAVIDITNPAGQLMELERARDYGVVTFVSYSSGHPSKMPTSLSKVMENWGIGYLFKYEHIDGLKKFVKSMLLINHLKGRTSEEILRAIVENGHKELLLITSIGVLNSEKDEKDRDIKKLLEAFGIKIIITGWDFKTRGKAEAEKYGAKAIVCEGCILYTKTNDEFSKTMDFCDDRSSRLVQTANRCIIHTIQDKYKKNSEQVVFFSQADEKSICYYLNPPKEKFEENNEKSPGGIEKIVESVKKEYVFSGTINGDKVEYPKLKKSQAVELLLYAIEKANAMYRTFQAYSIDVKDDKVIVDLKPKNDYKEFSYRDVESIVKIALAKMKRSDYEQLYNKVQAQKDICIDIFCKSKDEIFIPLLEEMVNDYRNTLVVYLSKGTESDIPMIFSGYSSKYNFIAIGSDNVSERLKRAGVIPLGESITMVISNFLRDFESVNTT